MPETRKRVLWGKETGTWKADHQNIRLEDLHHFSRCEELCWQAEDGLWLLGCKLMRRLSEADVKVLAIDED
jgi:hypothetical protein